MCVEIADSCEDAFSHPQSMYFVTLIVVLMLINHMYHITLASLKKKSLFLNGFNIITPTPTHLSYMSSVRYSSALCNYITENPIRGSHYRIKPKCSQVTCAELGCAVLCCSPDYISTIAVLYYSQHNTGTTSKNYGLK